MIQKRKIAVGVISGAVLLAVPLWLLSYPESTFQHNLKPWYIYSSQIAGIFGFTLYSLSLILATRLDRFEDFFGGLDKVYHIHHTIGRAALFFLLLHPLILALRWLPQDVSKTLLYLFPFHRRLAINLGSWALWGFILLMVLTLAIKIPYDKWKLTHKLTGIFFMLGIAHVFLLDELIAANLPLALYLGLFSVLGIISYFYKSVFFHQIKKRKSYTVEKVNRLNKKVMEVSLKPNGQRLQFTPGQFSFFSYQNAKVSTEAHPFTMCNVPSEDTITIIVKALGDYTTHLYKTLEPGTLALIEGPYGRFNYKKYSQPQVWIAGGVGIAPFISWANELGKHENPDKIKTDFFYCVNSETEAVYYQKFKKLEEKLRGFSFHLVCADKEGFLSAKDILEPQNRELFICGPKEMRKSLLSQLKELEVSGKNIHYEDFDFY